MLQHISNWLFPWPSHSKLGVRFLLNGLCIGVAIRAGMLWFIDFRFDRGDAVYYLNAAHNLLEYHIYSGNLNANPSPDMFRPPMYSFFITGVAWIFGNNPLYIQLVQMVVSIVTALLTTRMAAFFLPRSAPWVFGLMMLSPFEAVYTVAVLSETLTTFLLVAATYVILTFDGLKRWVIGGILIGLCVLTRDIYLPLIIIVAGFWIAFGKGRWNYRWLEASVLVISACLVILPWTLRNYHDSGRVVPISDGRLGLSLWMGTWAVNGGFTANDSIGGQRVYPAEAFRNQIEKNVIEKALAKMNKEGDKNLLHLAIQRIQDEPIAVLKVYSVRSPLLWLGTRFDIFQLNTIHFKRHSIPYTIAKSILWGINTIFIIFAFGGMVIAWKQRNRILILALPVFYTALIYFPLLSAENRYSQPVYPFLLIFAGVAAMNLTNKLKKPSRPE